MNELLKMMQGKFSYGPSVNTSDINTALSNGGLTLNSLSPTNVRPAVVPPPVVNSAPTNQTTNSPTNYNDPVQLSNAINSAINPQPQPQSQVQSSPTQDYYKTRGQQMDDRLFNRGAYYADPNAGYSPSQVEQIQNAGDKFYGSQLDTQAVDATRQSKPELTSGQASAFNNIVSQMNRSPLIAAADRVPVLQSSIANIRKNPSDAALQLNLAYSYIQALDTYQSAVREGELSLVNSIDSKVGQLGNFVTQMTDGQIVRPEVAMQIANAAESIVNVINASAKNKAKSFKSQAYAQGLNDVWDRYEGGASPSYNQTSNQTDSNSQNAVRVSATGGFDF